MEVSGKTANLSTLKDIKETLCEPCKEENISRAAGGIFKQCEEYMCCICFKNHLAARSCRKHEFIDSKGLQIEVPNVGENDNCEVCSKHKSEIIKYYCRHHDDVACGECMLLGEHKGCSPELIRCLANNFQKNDEFKGLTERIDNLKTRTGFTTNLIKLATEKNSKMNEDALTDIKMFMNDIREVINETEQDLLSKMSEIYLQNEETLSSMARMYESTETYLESVKRDINPLICSENALFIKSVEYKRTLVGIENICSETLKNTTVKRFELRKDDILLNKLKSLGSFGTISSVVQQIYGNQDYRSGFRNEHGDDDNRFNAAAHEDTLPVVRRAWDLSNLELVKNGPRHSGARGDDTSRRDIPGKSGADAKEKTSRHELTKSRPAATDKSELAVRPVTDRDGQPDSVPPESIGTFGTAVVSSPEWIGHATRQNFTGTVVGHRRKGFLKVLWSDGSIERCKFGINGQYDVLMSEDQSVDCSKLKIGSIVVRGKDWKWKDQDGGEGNVGVVTKICRVFVDVTWSHGGIGIYRYGYNKKFDLTLCKYRSGMHFVWYITDAEDEKWKRLPKNVNDNIEEMYKSKNTGTFLVKMDTQSLRISIQNLQARDTITQTAYNLERREMSDEEWLAVNNEK